MAIKINSDLYNKFKNILETFSQSSKVNENTFIQEIINRNSFATNIMEALSSIDVNDDNLVEQLNYFLENVSNYSIPITEVYSICGTSNIDLSSLLSYFYNYTGDIYTSQVKENIMISLENTTNRGIVDLLSLVQYSPSYDTDFYFVPIIKYSYRKSSEYFVNILEAMEYFYSSNEIATAINSNLTFINNELRTKYELIKSSYAIKKSNLLKLNFTNLIYDFIRFIYNFNFSYRDKTLTIDKCKKILLTNIYNTDRQTLLDEMAKDLYKIHLSETLAYDNRNVKFDAENYFSKLSIKELADITTDNFKYEFFKTYCTGNEEKINELLQYCEELYKFKSYLLSIKDAILSDKRFTMGG